MIMNACGYAVFPTVGKDGMGIGGAYGKGMVYRKGKATETAKLFNATIGFQRGGQAFSDIILFRINVLTMILQVETSSLMPPHPQWLLPPVPRQK